MQKPGLKLEIEIENTLSVLILVVVIISRIAQLWPMWGRLCKLGPQGIDVEASCYDITGHCHVVKWILKMTVEVSHAH